MSRFKNWAAFVVESKTYEIFVVYMWFYFILSLKFKLFDKTPPTVKIIIFVFGQSQYTYLQSQIIKQTSKDYRAR
jgi:hypothetical protein